MENPQFKWMTYPAWMIFKENLLFQMEDSSGQVKAIEAMAIERVDLPINSMVIFRSYVNVYQRVQVGL